MIKRMINFGHGSDRIVFAAELWIRIRSDSEAMACSDPDPYLNLGSGSKFDQRLSVSRPFRKYAGSNSDPRLMTKPDLIKKSLWIHNTR